MANLHKSLGLDVPTVRLSTGVEARLLPGPLFTLYVLLQGHLAAYRTCPPALSRGIWTAH